MTVPDRPIPSANEYVNNRLDALGSTETEAVFRSDREAVMRAYTSGTDINIGDLDTWAAHSTQRVIDSIAQHGETIGIDVLLHGLLVVAFLEGYPRPSLRGRSPAEQGRMSHPSDHRWGLEAPDYRPSIAVIEPPAQRTRRSPGPVDRVPFGFARVLIDRAACGLPHPRNPLSMGGCIKPLGHPPGHQWRPGDPAPIRPPTVSSPPELPIVPGDLSR